MKIVRRIISIMCALTMMVTVFSSCKKQEENASEEAKILVNRRMVEKLREPKRASAKRPMEQSESFLERIGEFFSAMSQTRKRTMAGMAAAALSLVFVIGGVSALAGPEPEAQYASRDMDVQVIDMAEVEENGNFLKG